MPPLTTTLLRALLCLCLLVDTLVPALAGTHLALAQLDNAAMALPPAIAAPDCHDTVGASADRTAPSDPDDTCLQRCLDLCLQHGVAAMPVLSRLAARAQVTAPTDPRHARPGPAGAGPPLPPPIA